MKWILTLYNIFQTEILAYYVIWHEGVERSICSVLEQTYPIEEVIIVDDCSTENTESIVKKMKDRRISFHKLGKNMGAGGARNIGVQKAHGELIAFQDSDDKWLPDMLKHNVFEKVVMEVLTQAKEENVLEQVSQIMEIYLS